MKLAEGNNPSWIDGLFASHPPSEERVKANEATVKALPKGGILGRDRYQKAMAYLRSKAPAYVDFDHAKTLESHNQYPQAMADVDHAIAIEPKEPRFYGLKGDILLAEGHYSPATTQFDKALARDPNYFEYYLGRGIALAKMGQPAKARTDLLASNKLLPTAVANKELGELALQTGDTAQARQYFQSAMSAQGQVGQDAGKAFVKLDLPDNPGKYITAQPFLTADRRMVAIVTNNSPYPVSNVRVVFQAVANGQPIQKAVTIASMAPGQKGSLASGWQFDATADIRGAQTTITAARVQ